ncbi:LysM peptidoglycan-binding domain-containing protein [Mesorhizobium sp. CAU 1741]|uniref:LysM peptidoglycan-binding domain-containing protein n=1 Tax=Mesorhizobium sp. CAU 1741 TaxID=3140366 RepID=UPI00325BD337
MVGWLKALLFVAGGATAAAGTAYLTGLFEPSADRDPPAIAALPDPVSPQPQPAPSDQPQDAPSVSEEPAEEPGDAATMDKQDRLVRPSFDILRVEPDGSLLIAGKAAADAMVDVLDGDLVLGTATAGPEGDFVIVLDDPLAPGDYQLSLRSISGDIVIMSEETAVVSVPETPDGEVLALVDTPGAPAELITVPESAEDAVAEGEADATADSAEGDDQQVAAAPVEQRSTQAPPASEPDNEAAGEEEEMATAPSTDAAEGQPDVVGDEPAPAEEENAVGAPDQQAAADDDASTDQQASREDDASTDQQAAADEGASTDQQASRDEDASRDQQAAPEQQASPDEPETPAGTTAPADQPAVVEQPADAAPRQDAGSDDGAVEDGEREIAALPEEEQESTADSQQDEAISYRVVVEAVEIEGGVIYVAGQAIPGRVVRVYADETLLGESAVSEAGRFLVEARRELPVGSYMIRADLLEADGSVVARAAVPFEREPGEAIAAVAPRVTPQAQDAPAPSAATPEQQPSEQAATETETAAAPALQSVDRGVIIRRGDSLWRISRRVYGRGVRYSTIYLANQDQIRNPDMIWPGQVFSVPETTPEGELADMDAIADQVADPDAETVEQ